VYEYAISGDKFLAAIWDIGVGQRASDFLKQVLLIVDRRIDRMLGTHFSA
jgi:hypothetical protein